MAIEDLRGRDWILLPGTLCTADVFSGFLDALGVPDKRRHPVSLCHSTVEAYADSLTSQARSAVVCGFSLGAIIAAHHADRLRAHRIILFALNPYPDGPEKTASRHELARDVAAMGGSEALSSRLLPPLGPNRDQARVAILAMAEAATGDIDAQTHLALTRPGAMDALARAQSRVLVLSGSEDQLAPAHQGQAAADAAPEGQFRRLPGLGHYALVEDPVACAQAVEEMEDGFP